MILVGGIAITAALLLVAYELGRIQRVLEAVHISLDVQRKSIAETRARLARLESIEHNRQINAAMIGGTKL